MHKYVNARALGIPTYKWPTIHSEEQASAILSSLVTTVLAFPVNIRMDLRMKSETSSLCVNRRKCFQF
jgi:hypothetical protein